MIEVNVGTEKFLVFFDSVTIKEFISCFVTFAWRMCVFVKGSEIVRCVYVYPVPSGFNEA